MSTTNQIGCVRQRLGMQAKTPAPPRCVNFSRQQWSRPLACIFLLAASLHAAVVLDRIAVIVGSHVIKASDIDREIRTTAFLNGEKPDFSPDAKRKAASRLIDQQIIRTELENGGYPTPTPEEVDAFVRGVTKQRFHSDAEYERTLREYGLTDHQLRSQLDWQLTVLKFINERFRPGVLITDDDLRSYYEQHRADLTREYPKLTTFDQLAPKIREKLEGERINQQFFAWLDEQRKEQHIEYRQGAFES